MSLLELFTTELGNNETQYFIFDSSPDSHHEDKDFIEYNWETDKFNQVKTGDLFIYRRPQKSSEISEFYFYGVGKVAKIRNNDGASVTAEVVKGLPFEQDVLQSDLINFNWTFKKKEKETFANFFNQYGMMKINIEDFSSLCQLGFGESLPDYSQQESLDVTRQIKDKNYRAEDHWSESKKRVGQQQFSREVKKNYSNTCSGCGIDEVSFLIGSHIIPWADDKNRRLDPTNGICFCVLCDKAFDKGYFVINQDFRIRFTDKLNKNKTLVEKLHIKDGQKLSLPKKKALRPDLLAVNCHYQKHKD